MPSRILYAAAWKCKEKHENTQCAIYNNNNKKQQQQQQQSNLFR